jgi:excisionase family DNA binding protein
MLWTVKQTARFLGLELHQVYYLLVMGEIEAVKAGVAWRVVPEAVEEYDKRRPERKDRSPAGNFVYQGGGGLLFCSLPDRLPSDSAGNNAGLQRRRGPLVHSAERPQNVLLKTLKPVEQLELFSA